MIRCFLFLLITFSSLFGQMSNNSLPKVNHTVPVILPTRDSEHDQSTSTHIGFSAAVVFPMGEGAQYWKRGVYGGFTLLTPLSSQHYIGLHLGIGKFGINRGEIKSELVKLTGALPREGIPKITGSIREIQAYVLLRQNSPAFQSASNAMFLQFLAGLVNMYSEAKLNATIKNEYISVSDTENETVACIGAGIGYRIGNDQKHVPLEILPVYQYFFTEEQSSQFSISLQILF
ncbi:hypothetical protein GF406_05030 [candidate division KSB1 bacterium]|nr:hypothetical protein [candidate division KSB1 bacterium]